MVHADLSNLLVDVARIIVDIVIVPRRMHRFRPFLAIIGVRHLVRVPIPLPRLRRRKHHLIIVVNSLPSPIIMLSLVHFFINI